MSYLNEIKRENLLPGEVLWFQAALGGHAPDLEEVHRSIPIAFLAVPNSGSRRGHLEVAPLEDLGVAHRVAAVGYSISQDASPGAF